ncbi:MAG TPA: hypothetical protein VG276_28560 [Actinomycetes bacterium]|nr:hypothetical protein [Actinomycetes bacterium]
MPRRVIPLFAGALALLIGVLATGGEYGWDTVKVLLTLGPRGSWRPRRC